MARNPDADLRRLERQACGDDTARAVLARRLFRAGQADRVLDLAERCDDYTLAWSVVNYVAQHAPFPPEMMPLAMRAQSVEAAIWARRHPPESYGGAAPAWAVNPDEDLRRLEKRARAGDVSAYRAWIRLATRAGRFSDGLAPRVYGWGVAQPRGDAPGAWPFLRRNPRPAREPDGWFKRIGAQSRLGRIKSRRSARGVPAGWRGVKLATEDGRFWFVVTPSVRGEPGFQVTTFSGRDDTPLGHFNCPTLDEAVVELHRDYGPVYVVEHNPLTGVEAHAELVHGLRNLHEAGRSTVPVHAAYRAGKAHARAAVVQAHGPLTHRAPAGELRARSRALADAAGRVVRGNPDEDLRGLGRGFVPQQATADEWAALIARARRHGMRVLATTPSGIKLVVWSASGSYFGETAVFVGEVGSTWREWIGTSSIVSVELVPPQHGTNPDEDLRALERAAASGDELARVRLHRERGRRGELRKSPDTAPLVHPNTLDVETWEERGNLRIDLVHTPTGRVLWSASDDAARELFEDGVLRPRTLRRDVTLHAQDVGAVRLRSRGAYRSCHCSTFPDPTCRVHWRLR